MNHDREAFIPSSGTAIGLPGDAFINIIGGDASIERDIARAEATSLRKSRDAFRVMRDGWETLARSRGDRLDDLHNEVERLRQGLWECAVTARTAGQPTPVALSPPDIVDYATRAVQDLRDCYDEALR